MTRGPEALWRAASKVLQGMLSAELFGRWFAPIKPISLHNGTLVLGVVDEFSLIWLQDNFLPLIREAVGQAGGSPIQVRLSVAHPSSSTAKPVPPSPAAQEPSQT